MMKILLKVFILSLLILFSCKNDDGELNLEPILKLNESITIDGITRNFHVQHPVDHQNKPLVIVLHGHGGSADQSLGLATGKNPQRIWLDVAKEQSFIVVVPNGELGSEGNRGWNDCRRDAPTNPTTDDVKFIETLIDKIQETYDHNTDRVYVTGVSNGALMTHRLTEEIPEKIAAVALIVNNMPENSVCPQSNEPISALYMNGTIDLFVPYDGGQIIDNRGLVKSTDECITYWVNRNQTDTIPKIENFENISINDNSTVEKYTYKNGLENTEVILYKVLGGGHTEPSIIEKYSQIYLNIVGEQNEDIEMAEEVWSFFEDKIK